MKRRKFLTASAACAGATTASVSIANAAPRTNPSGVSGYDYRLPKLKTGSRLLFQGDSITDMKWGRNEKDRNHYLGHSYVYLIASRLGVDMPEAKLDVYNRGMSGHTVGDLKMRWQKDAIDMKPDLLSILIGVNDVGRSGAKRVDYATWENDYRHILNQSREANPALKLVLLNPFVLPTGRLAGDAFKKWSTDVFELGKIVAQLAKEFDAVRIETDKIFLAAADQAGAENWIWDGVHPLPQGHELIARNWVEKVSERWG